MLRSIAGMRGVIAGTVVNNPGISNRQLHLFPAEGLMGYDCKQLQIGVEKGFQGRIRSL